jgi:predicted dehydrogenase
MARRISRREMLRSTAVAGFGVWVAGAHGKLNAYSPNETLKVAVIGVGGRGGANLNGLGRLKEVSIVAMCDVDDARAGGAYKKYSGAKKFYDFRKMFDEMHGDIDAVAVSTPDHTHFHPSMAALQLGKHLYCEKPMAHSIWEARQMTDLARKNKLATQLGVQRHTHGNVHRVVEMIQGGSIGTVRECHAWVGGSRGMPKMPTGTPKVPDGLKWDLWLGPAAERSYSKAYCPYGWRFWWDFGTGETGNWGCHILDIPFWALDLKFPTRVEGSGPPVDAQRTPKSMTTRLDFPANGKQPPVTLHWYHSQSGPAILKEHNLPHFGSGVLFVGSDGMLLCDFGKHRLFPEAKFEGFKPPPQSIPNSPGFHREFLNACRGGIAATCNFDYSGPMAEAVLIANVAYRAGGSFEWDAKTLRTTGNSKAQALIRPTFRKGWEA